MTVFMNALHGYMFSCLFSTVEDDVLVRLMHLNLIENSWWQTLYHAVPDENSYILCGAVE